MPCACSRQCSRSVGGPVTLGAVPVNCHRLPVSAPRVADVRTRIALGHPEAPNSLICREIPMGSIPITRSFPRQCRASCGNSGVGNSLVAWGIPWRPPHRSGSCRCRGLSYLAPAVAPDSNRKFKVRIRGRERSPSTRRKATQCGQRWDWILAVGHQPSFSISSRIHPERTVV